jgi:large subunit ribosomal protein L19
MSDEILKEEAAPKEETAVSVALEQTHPEATKEISIKDLKPGMTIRVHERIQDVSAKGEERERIQIFQGIIIAMRGGNVSRTMTVRKVSGGYGVEKIYPLQSPSISKVELVKQAKVRRAKLSYLKNLRHIFKRKLKETWTE